MEFKYLLGKLMMAQVIACIMSQNTLFDERVRKCLQEKNNSLSECLKFFLDDINKEYSTVGIPELNIPPFDPMHLDNLKFQRDDGSISLKATFKNVLAAGFKNRDIKRIRYNKAKKTLSIRVLIPTFHIKGLYDLKGRVLAVNITGNGDFTVDVDKVFAILNTQITEKNEGGRQILTAQNTRLDLKFNKIHTHLFNLFNGDETMGTAVNHFINANHELILKEVEDELTMRIAQLVEPMLVKGMSYFPLEVAL